VAGIYIHIPFCRRACHYCNFHFSTSLKGKNDFLEALLKEAALQKDYLEGSPVETIYFGGGTPSLLESGELQDILSAIHKHYNVQPTAEITLEANPDDITADKLADWKNSGVNRLSIGVQSFFEADLRWMNRAHSAEQARNCIKLSQDAGFTNLTIDLIYGTPTLTDKNWDKNIGEAVKAGIPHLSCYALTVEQGTALEVMIKKNKVAAADTEVQARQFTQLINRLQQEGYEHYEISNFALPGMRSRHNSAYWSGERYLGLGPSAHSFNGRSRQWNIAGNALYVHALKRDELPFEKEELTHQQKVNEYIMTSLRTIEGLDLGFVSKNFGEEVVNQLQQNSRKYMDTGKLLHRDNHFQLTNEGKLFADGIAADLFMD
jgi:oxygen-independent coproporphyrinogen III oxidase